MNNDNKRYMKTLDKEERSAKHLDMYSTANDTV